MVETYTTQWFTVTDGDSTTQNPQSLVATTSPIVVLDAEIRWEGIESTEEVTETEYATNTNTTSATATTSTDEDFNSGGDITSSGDEGASATLPSVPSGYSFDRHEMSMSIDVDGTDPDVEVTYEDLFGNTYTETITSSGVTTLVDDLATINYVGESRVAAFTVNSGSVVNLAIDVFTYGTDETVNSETSCTSYPSVPSGYTFDRHYYREEKDGSTVSSDYSYTNSVGDDRCVTSDDPSTTWELLMRTRGSDETTTTQTLNTLDPSVSGDVSGAYSGTLTDGEQSPWQSLSGLTADSETFTHQISESATAKFQFRFDWAYDAATPTHGTVGFLDAAAGVWRECAVAAPDDPALQYDHVGVYNDATSAWGVLDLVDASADGAISGYEVYDPDVGWLAPRQYSTTAI